MNDQISRQKLKPCPFCGGDKIRLTNWGLYRCWCANCLAQAADEISKKDAVEAWNKRVEPPANQWIPVTYRETTEEERECGIEWKYILDCPLPDNDTEILVCTKAGSVWTDTFFNDDGCYLDGGYDLTEIAAWMPLPEPYKGGWSR